MRILPSRSFDLGGRVDAELSPQPRPQLLIGAQRLGLATSAIQGEHELGGEPFPQRMLPGQALELRHQLAVAPSCEIRLDTSLDGFETQLVEPADLCLGERLVGELLVGPSPPQLQGAAQGRRRRLRVLAQQCAPVVDQVLEPNRVDLLPVDVEDVPGRSGANDGPLRPGLPIRLQRRPQVGDVHPQCVLTIRGLVTPQLVEEPIRRQHGAVVDEEEGEQRPLLVRTKCDRTMTVDDPELSENPELHDPASSHEPSRRAWNPRLKAAFRLAKLPLSASHVGMKSPVGWSAPCGTISHAQLPSSPSSPSSPSAPAPRPLP